MLVVSVRGRRHVRVRLRGELLGGVFGVVWVSLFLQNSPRNIR